MVPGFAPGYSEPLRLSPGDELGGLTIRLGIGASFQGRITHGGDLGVEGAVINLRSANDYIFRYILNNVSNQGGYYEVQHLETGKYYVCATHPEYAPSDEVLVSAEDNQVVRVPPLVLSIGGSISGRTTEK